MYNDSPTTRPPIEKETTEKDPIPTKEHDPTTAEKPHITDPSTTIPETENIPLNPDMPPITESGPIPQNNEMVPIATLRARLRKNAQPTQPSKRIKITMAAKGKEKIPERTSKAPLEAAPRKSGKRKAPEQALKIKIGKGKDKATKSSDSPPDVKPPPKKTKTPAEPCVKVRQSTAPFKAFLAAIANQPQKRQAIIDMGFGGLLELDMPKNDPIFCARLLSRYSVGSGSLMLRRGREIEIRDIDVHLVYGIPLGGLLVDDNKDNDAADYRLMLEEWREYVGVQRGSPYVSTMATHLADAAVPVTDNWKRTFLVVAVNCCIKSTLNPQPLTGFLSTTIDVNNIPNYNWCKYTIESLLHSACSWQEDTTRFFAGPLPFLQVCYFDRLQKELHKPPRAFPLLSVWKREIIRSRISYEFRSGLGMGTVLPRIPAPMHGQQDDEQQQQQQRDQQQHHQRHQQHQQDEQQQQQQHRQQQQPHHEQHQQPPTDLETWKSNLMNVCSKFTANLIELTALLNQGPQLTGDPMHLLFPNASNPPPSTPEQEQEDRKIARLTENTRMEQFVERLTYECRDQGITNVNQFDLVFFPVCASDHFYVFCLNFNKMTLDILDNKILPENVSIHDKYKDYPAKIAIAYGRFLVSLGYNMISSPLRPRIVEMPWRTNVNTYDCGIYAMRHMEKYNGEWEDNFETGLTADNFDMIKQLRIQYCIDILMSIVNTRASWVADRAKAQAKGKSKDT
ncbi:hypothetical protein BVRB_3g060470 [Beta vulgaris subsp. vulgaris]|nr:hypothetical protein BVRB_3g060470 [Beta vulgaris subsp. vulgaris]